MTAVLADLRAGLRGALLAGNVPRATVSVPALAVTVNGFTGLDWTTAPVYPGDEITVTGPGIVANTGNFLVLGVTPARLVVARPPLRPATLTAEAARPGIVTVPMISRLYWDGGPIAGAPADWPYLRDQFVVQSSRRRSLADDNRAVRYEGTWLVDVVLGSGYGTAASDAWIDTLMTRLLPGHTVLTPQGRAVRLRGVSVAGPQYLPDRLMRSCTVTWSADATLP